MTAKVINDPQKIFTKIYKLFDVREVIGSS